MLSHKSRRKWLTGFADITGYQWDVSTNLLGTTGKGFPSWWDNRSVRWKKICPHPFCYRLEPDAVILGGPAATSSYQARRCPHTVDGKFERCRDWWHLWTTKPILRPPTSGFQVNEIVNILWFKPLPLDFLFLGLIQICKNKNFLWQKTQWTKWEKIIVT